MSSGKNFEIAGSGSAGGGDEGDEAARIKIARDGIVDGSERAENGFVGAKIGA